MKNFSLLSSPTCSGIIKQYLRCSNNVDIIVTAENDLQAKLQIKDPHSFVYGKTMLPFEEIMHQLLHALDQRIV